MQSVDEVIEVTAPVAEVWARWADVERLSEFMEGIDSVRRDGDDHLAWTATFGGESVAWTSRITEWEPGTALAWRSEDGTSDAGGRVELTGTDAGTRVHVVIDWPSEGMVEVSLERLRALVEG